MGGRGEARGATARNRDARALHYYRRRSDTDMPRYFAIGAFPAHSQLPAAVSLSPKNSPKKTGSPASRALCALWLLDDCLTRCSVGNRVPQTPGETSGGRQYYIYILCFVYM